MPNRPGPRSLLCSRCGAPRHRTSTGRLYDFCQPCRREANRKWVKANPEKARASELKGRFTSYGITREIFNQMLLDQQGLCAIGFCEMVIPDKGRLQKGAHTACIDHDHRTDQVRGVLCIECNAALGMLHDNIDNFLSAISYLSRFQS